MKKYTVYIVSLLFLTGIASGALHAAAAPAQGQGEEDIKELANPKEMTDLYASLSGDILNLRHQLEQCEIDTGYEKDMQAVYGFFERAMDPSHIAFGGTTFEYASRAYGDATNRRILKLTQEIKELKQQISQQKRAGWWEWITTWKKNRAEFHGVRDEHIVSKTKEKHDLEEQLISCKNDLSVLRGANQEYKDKFYGMPPEELEPISVPEYFNYVRLLSRVTKKTDRKRDLMLEKFKLQRILENLERSTATTYDVLPGSQE